MAEITPDVWPEKGDKAFVLPGFPICNLQMAAFVQGDANPFGFKLAAEKIIEGANEGLYNADSLFCPVCYLYRHYLELMLKSIFRIGLAAEVVTDNDKILENHNLHKLWNKVRALFSLVWPSGNGIARDAVERVILEFHRLDPGSTGLRYGTDRHGQLEIQSVPRCVDLLNLRKTMDGVAAYLTASEAGIIHYYQA